MLTLPLDRPHPLRPPPAYADLAPVTRVHTPDGPAWLVTGFDADAARLVARMLDAGLTADLVEALSAPLAIGIVGRLLGVPTPDIRRFHETVGTALTIEDGWERMQAFTVELIDAKRTTPDDGLLSTLITTRDADDGRMTDAELVAMSTVLIVAGYQPVAYAIAIGAMVLLDTDHLADLADPARRDPAVEELLRYQSGIGGEPFPRWAQEDTELAGTPIAGGDTLLVRLEAAHRDPEHFPDPHAFDPGRAGNPHMAFGRGPHHCLGAALARLGVGAALGALAERVPTLRLAVPVEDVEWQQHYADTFPTAVPVTW